MLTIASFSLLLIFLADEAAAASRLRGIDNPKNPIVIVPGMGGSRLSAKLNKTHSEHVGCFLHSDWYDLWVDIVQLTFALRCFIDNAKLSYNPRSRKTSNTPGVTIQVTGFGDTSTIEWLDRSHLPGTDYMKSLVEFLVDEHKYVRGVSVRGAPYDFRHTPIEIPEYFDALRSLIESTYSMNNDRKVIVMGHSLGNLNILYFLNLHSQSWKDKYIKSFVSIAGPYGGSVKALRLLASGDDLNIKILRTLPFRELERSFPSSILIMPVDTYWSKEEVLVQGPQRNYTVKDYKQFFTDIDHPTGYYMRQDTENHIVKRFQAPGVEVHCLHGSNVRTIASMSYAHINLKTSDSNTPNSTQRTTKKPARNPATNAAISNYADATLYSDVDDQRSKWYDHQPRLMYGDGDGTVNMRSLKGCCKWTKTQSQSVICREFPGEDHKSILNSKGLKSYLSSILS